MTGLEVAVRFVHLASVLLLVGSFSFELLVSRPVFKNVGIQTALDFPSFDKTLFSIARLSLLLAMCTAVLGLFIKIANATGLPLSESLGFGTIINVLTGTRFGIVWLVRMALFCLLAFVISVHLQGRFKIDSAGLCVTELLLSGTLLILMAAAGHASAAEGMTLFVQLTIDVLHLFSSGRMVGRTDPSRVVLSLDQGSAGVASNLIIAQEVTARFSRLGLASVVLLLITGLFNAWYLVGGIPPLLGTTYGYLLLAKLGVLIPLMGLASRNRWHLKPRLANLAARNDLRKSPGC